MRYRDKDGVRRRESTFTEDWTEAQKCLRQRLQARDNNTLPALRRGHDLTFGEWSDFYLENFSRPPFRAPKTHEVNERALKHLRKMFENTKLAELTADDIEGFLRRRLKQRVQVKAKNGFVEKGLLKATTVHQELRVLRRMLNVAVRKKFLFAVIHVLALSFRRGWMDCFGRTMSPGPNNRRSSSPHRNTCVTSSGS
jgi:hypothetical protein